MLNRCFSIPAFFLTFVLLSLQLQMIFNDETAPGGVRLWALVSVAPAALDDPLGARSRQLPSGVSLCRVRQPPPDCSAYRNLWLYIEKTRLDYSCIIYLFSKRQVSS
ncbi:hypothetical protein L596_009098 [Steinernema carpocapsae]|uniref:Secreted protein n=1 Tax=Steinernema carpocapsae TaxID=34508 RepID=A0A4U5PFK4_STECR|nr:hypothetical protein L596_009098 [Steinernema carpocapsae]